MTVLGGLIYIICVGIGLLTAWVIINPPSRELENLKAQERQRSVLAYQIAYDAAHTDWLTKWRFRRYLRKGGNHFL